MSKSAILDSIVNQITKAAQAADNAGLGALAFSLYEAKDLVEDAYDAGVDDDDIVIDENERLRDIFELAYSEFGAVIFTITATTAFATVGSSGIVISVAAFLVAEVTDDFLTILADNWGITTAGRDINYSMASEGQTIIGTTAGDTFTTSEFDDIVFLAGGSDVLSVVGGSNDIDGGTGWDSVSYEALASSVGIVFDNRTAPDSLVVQHGSEIDQLANVEILIGTDGADTFRLGNLGSNMAFGGYLREAYAGAGDDVVFLHDKGGAGPNVLHVDGGSEDRGDLLVIATENVTTFVNFETGEARFSGGLNTHFSIYDFENFQGDSGNDIFTGDEKNNHVLTFGGRDRIFAGTGEDTVEGGDDSDLILIKGGEGIDILRGMQGNDTITGDSGGVDLIEGGSGIDGIIIEQGKVWGQQDADEISAIGEGAVELYGGSGGDTLDASAATGNAVIKGGSEADTLYGNGQSILTGGSGADIFHVQAGDTITDSEAHDQLWFDGVQITEDMDALMAIEIGSSSDHGLLPQFTGGEYNGYDAGETLTSDVALAWRVTGLADDFDGTTSGILYDLYLFSNVSVEGHSGTGMPSASGRLYANDADVTISGFRQGDFGLFLNGIGGLGVLHNTFAVSGRLIHDGEDYGLGLGLGQGLAHFVSDEDREAEEIFEKLTEETADLLTQDRVGGTTGIGGDADDFFIADTGQGSTSFTGGRGGDTALMSQDGDFAVGEDGDDLLIGREGNDDLSGGIGNDRIFGGDVSGISLLISPTQAANSNIEFSDDDTLLGGGGDDLIRGGEGNDSIDGGADNDRLYGDAGNDLLLGSTGNDTVRGGDGDDNIDGGLGNDNLGGDADNDLIRGGTGNDTIRGGSGQDLLHGDEGADDIRGGSGDDFIEGGGGADTITAASGDDSIIGGLGDDNLQGGVGNDTYYYAAGDGNDTILDTGPYAYQDTDRIVFEGIASTDVSFLRDGDDLLINLVDGSVITLDRQFQEDNAEIEFADFSDGITQDISAFALGQLGSDDDDLLIGDYRDEQLFGFGGNDTLDGGAGNDAHFGGAGNDVILGNSGDDTFEGGAGTDTLDFSYTSTGFTMDLGAGTVAWPGNFVEAATGFENGIGGRGADTLIGSDGNNLLDGGAGNDAHFGGAGDDTILGNSGDDTFEGGTGIDTLDFSYTSTGFTMNLGAGTVSWPGNFVEGATGFENGIGGSGADTMIGSVADNRLDGGIGNDVYIYRLGGGNDVISDSDATGTLDLTTIASTDVSFGDDGSGNLSITFSDGAVVLVEGQLSDGGLTAIALGAGETLNAAGIADKLATDSGNNPDGVVAGTAGSDVIDASYLDDDGDVISDLGQLIQGLDGEDQISDGAGDDTVEGGAGRDYFYAGAGADVFDGGGDNRDTVLYSRSNIGLVIDTRTPSNSTGIAGGDTFISIERLHGTAYDDTIVVDAGLWAFGDVGDDILQDSAGTQRLTGGSGADTFRFVAGDGVQDRVSDFELGIDLIDISAWGVTSFDQLTLTERVNGQGSPTGDVTLAFGSETVRLDGFSDTDTASFGAADFIFADGPPATGNGVINGTSGNDFIDVSFIDEDGDMISDDGQLIQSMGGADSIYDGAGDDTVQGGAGRDNLYAGGGSDAYDGGADRDAVFYQASAVGLTIDMLDGSNGTGIAAGDTFASIERLYGTGFGDTIVVGSGVWAFGEDGDDVLQDSGGSEQMSGGQGADTFVFTLDGTMDRILDFELGTDIINLSAWGASSVADLTMVERTSGQGTPQGDLLLTFGSETTRIDGYDASYIASFDDSSFVF